MSDQSEAKRFVELPTIRRLAPLRSFKPDTRTVELVWSAGARVQRFDWWEGESFFEELDMSADSVDLSRLNNGASVLDSHDRFELSKIVGVTERAWLDGGQGIASVRFSRRADVEPIVQDVADGIIRHVSVGYSIQKLEQRGFDEQTGYKIMVATRWQPFEISLVAVGADDNATLRSRQPVEKTRCLVVVSATRDEPKSQTSPVAGPVQVTVEDCAVEQIQEPAASAASLTAEQRVNQPADTARKGPVMDPQVNASAGGNAGTQAIVNLTAVEAEKERRQAIINLCKSNKIDARIEARWIEDGTRLEKVASEILDVMEERGRNKPQSAANLGLTSKETNNYSLFRAIRAMRFGQQDQRLMQEAAFELECSRTVAKQLGRQQSSSMLVPAEVLARPLGREVAERAMSAVPGSKGGYMVNVDNMGFIDILRNRSVAMAMGARVLSGLQGNVTFPRQTGKVTVTWQAGEGTSTTAADQALGQLSMTPKTCIAITDVSEQLLAQASPSAEAFVMADLARDVAIDGVDAATINGTGGAQPLGIKNTTGITSGQDASSATYAKILAFVSTAGAANAILGNPGFVTNTAGAARLMQVQRFSSTDTPLWVGNMLDGQCVGFRAMSSEQLASGNIVFGSWDQLVIGEWGVLELSTDNGGTRFNTAQVGIRAMWMVDVMLRYPQAFIVGTNLS